MKCYRMFFIVTVFLGALALIGDYKISAKMKYLAENKEYKYDLDGDGKKESIKYTMEGYSEDWENGYDKYEFKLYINGKLAFSQNEKDRWVYELGVEIFDYNPADKYQDIMITYSDLNDTYGRDVYRYKKNKLSLYFTFGNVTEPYALIPEKQKNDEYILIDNIRVSLLGHFYVREKYKIKNGKLVLVKPKNYEYKMIKDDNFYYEREKIQWYDLKSGVYLHMEDGSYGYLQEGTRFYVTKLRCNMVETYYGLTFPELAQAYIITSSGEKGWINIGTYGHWYDDCIVENPCIYGM